MRIDITARHLRLTKSFKEAIKEHIEKLSRFDSSLDNSQIIIFKDKDEFVIEIQLKGRHHNFFSKESTETLQDSLKGVIEKLERQLRKHKTKLSPKKNKKKISEIENVLANVGRRIKKNPEVIEYRDVLGKPKSVEEAIFAMKEKGYLFKPFINSATNRINIIFFKRDGNYGLIVL